jgi:hypothetical protein
MLVRFAACVALASPVVAGDRSVAAQVTSAPGVFPVTFYFQQFDPALGQLESVSANSMATLQGWVDYENLNPTACMSVSGNPYLSGFVNCLGFSVYLSGWDNYGWFLFMSPFDGTIDFSGSSATRLDYTAGSPGLWGGSGIVDHQLVGPQSLLIGTGTIFGDWQVGGGGPSLGPCDSVFPPNVAVDDHHSYSFSLTITYHYSDYPARYCFGSFGGCPCGFGLNGCPNSAESNGSELTPLGQSHVLADDFTLHASGMPSSTSVLFFQGTEQVAPVTFGDGTRCVGGLLLRLGVKHASGGVANYPVPGDPSISVKGVVPVGAYRTYQAWYRDPAPGFCTPAPFNLTSAVATVWAP